MKLFMTTTVLMASMLSGAYEMKQGMELVKDVMQQEKAQMQAIKQMTNEAYGMNVYPAGNSNTNASE